VLDKLFQLGATTSELWPKGGENVMWKWGGAMGWGSRVTLGWLANEFVQPYDLGQVQAWLQAPGSLSSLPSRRFHASASLRSAWHFGCHGHLEPPIAYCHLAVPLPLPLGHLAASSPPRAISLNQLTFICRHNTTTKFSLPASFTGWFIGLSLAKAVSPAAAAGNWKNASHKWNCICILVAMRASSHRNEILRSSLADWKVILHMFLYFKP